MAKFIYKLQNVLDLKLKMEDQAKSTFAQAMIKLNEQEQLLDQMRKQKLAYEEEFRRLASGRINPVSIKHAKENIEGMDALIKNQVISVKAAQKNLEVARYKLNESIKERKIQEKLKENAFEDFKHEIAEEEKKEIDELVSFRFNKNGEAGVK